MVHRRNWSSTIDLNTTLMNYFVQVATRHSNKCLGKQPKHVQLRKYSNILGAVESFRHLIADRDPKKSQETSSSSEFVGPEQSSFFQ